MCKINIISCSRKDKCYIYEVGILVVFVIQWEVLQNGILSQGLKDINLGTFNQAWPTPARRSTNNHRREGYELGLGIIFYTPWCSDEEPKYDIRTFANPVFALLWIRYGSYVFMFTMMKISVVIYS
jgi:hypothetical protein